MNKEFTFVTTFTLSGTQDRFVYFALLNYSKIPTWWSSLRKCKFVTSFSSKYFGRVQCIIATDLYDLEFYLFPKGTWPFSTLSFSSIGDLKGVGRFRLEEKNNVVSVAFEWKVTLVKQLSQSREVFTSEHSKVMRSFAQGLSTRSSSVLSNFKSIEIS